MTTTKSVLTTVAAIAAGLVVGALLFRAPAEPVAAETSQDAAGDTEEVRAYMTTVAESIVDVRVAMTAMGNSYDDLRANESLETLRRATDAWEDARIVLSEYIIALDAEPPAGFEGINNSYREGLVAAREGIDLSVDCLAGDEIACEESKLKLSTWQRETERVFDFMENV